MFFKAIETPDMLDRWYPDDSVTHVSKVDNSPNQEFNYNQIGWIRNNIASLMSIQNESAFQLAYSRLKEFADGSNLVDYLSDTDNLRLILPKNYQDPVEFSRFIDYVAKVNEDFGMNLANSVKDIPDENIEESKGSE